MRRVDRHIHRYLDALYSYRRATIEHLEWTLKPNGGFVAARLRFWNGSMPEFNETVAQVGVIIKRVAYVFHYQDAAANLILRYDNAPHHPEVSTYPHHKHVGERIEPSDAPDLSDVLREIEKVLASGE